MPLISVNVENIIINFSGKLLLLICLIGFPTISNCVITGLQGLKANLLGKHDYCLTELLCVCSCYTISTESQRALDCRCKWFAHCY